MIKEDPGNRKILLSLANIKDTTETGIRRGLYRIGKRNIKDVRDGIKNPPKTGRYYKYKGRRKRASAPGEFPANRSGTLRRSTDFKVQGAKRMQMTAGAFYAPFLEDGTKNMRPREFLIRVIKENEKVNWNQMQESMKEELMRSHG
jgi:HK97 gp10 family phage protein